MIVFEKKRGKIVLNDQDFLAEGGEGRLFVQGNDVYKIYHEPTHVIPAAKFDELATLQHPGIIRPRALLTNDKHEPVGYVMPRAPSAVPLAQLFSSSFRDQYQITPLMTVDLVKAMQNVISEIHKKNILMVDGNEFNYLVDQRNWVTPYFIDVDSWQTPSFKASAIMPSIRDYTARDFSSLTDWFSFAIVACQLFIGIHPFKGRHPDFKKGDFEARIRANMSVFNPAVTYPSAVRDFSLIPKPYLDWFVDLFEKGIRRPPPDERVHIAAVVRRVEIRDGALVQFKPLETYPGSVRRYNVLNGTTMAFVGQTLHIGRVPFRIPQFTQGVVLLENHAPLFLGIDNQLLQITAPAGISVMPVQLRAQQLFVSGNQAYLIHDHHLMELQINRIANRVVVSPGKVFHIMPNAHRVFTGLLHQTVLGKHYLVIPFKAGSVAQIAMPELQDYKVIDARYEKGVALLKIANRLGQYDVLRVRFNAEHTRYDVQVSHDIDEPINFAVLDNGVTVHMIEDGRIDIFLNRMAAADVRVVKDNQLRMAMQLVNHGGRLAAIADREIMALSLGT